MTHSSSIAAALSTAAHCSRHRALQFESFFAVPFICPWLLSWLRRHVISQLIIDSLTKSSNPARDTTHFLANLLVVLGVLVL